jgi:isocitrate dehydrogenase
MALVKGAGYSFTPEEIKNVAGELADDVLSAVVGGIGMSGSGTYVK